MFARRVLTAPATHRLKLGPNPTSLYRRATNTAPSRSFSMAAASAKDLYYHHGLKTLSPESTILKTLERLGMDFHEVPLEASPFVKPHSVMYTMDGKPRRWDVVESHPSVGVVLYHSEMDAFIIVRQFRPAVYVSRRREAAAAGLPPPPLAAGFTHELCAGLVDKPGKSLAAICAEEVAEECGYSLPAEQLQEVSSAVAAAGTSGSTHTIFYGKLSESMRVSCGGGLATAGEAIEVLALPLANVPAFVTDSSVAKSPGLMFGLLWAYQGLTSGQLPGRGGSAMETDTLLLKPVACA